MCSNITWIGKLHKLKKRYTKLLCFQDVKHAKENENVSENVSKSFSSFEKLKKPNIQATCREITTDMLRYELEVKF
jgi:hypothetical protein